jgi:phosphohistidine phosphatase
MDLWLLRHATAEERSSSGRDEDRALTADGAKRARAVARGLAALEPGISLVLTSPYRRARQTAEPVLEALGVSRKLRESQALEPARDPEEIIAEVQAEEAESVLLVGHQPHLGALLGHLVTGGRFEIPLKKASVARVTLEGRGLGALRALLPARVLEELGRARG